MYNSNFPTPSYRNSSPFVGKQKKKGGGSNNRPRTQFLSHWKQKSEFSLSETFQD